MSERSIVFSPRAMARVEAISDNLLQQHLSKKFVVEYLADLENWLNRVLLEFPNAGTSMPNLGLGLRRVVYKRYSFIYRIKGQKIEILTIYRDNLP